MKPNPFRKKLLASSISSLVLVSSGAFAQGDAGVEEEVIVTGIKGSLLQSMDVKREAVGVVDAISAEDIGKMPDTNLAESLQRIAGVSISRTNGEGSQVTIRGIDPALNMVLLNNRMMPTVTNNGTAGDKSSRAFDFANLASESVNAVEVYKTGKANVSGGGLGGTINLKTLRPLDLGETKFTVGGKAVHDTTVYRGEDGDEITPEVSGLFSWVNDNDNFGVSLSASYQERDNVRASAFVNNWQFFERGTEGSNPPQVVLDQLNAGDFYAMPTDLRYTLEDNHRERTNAQLTMQFKPVESLTATIDYTYSENDLSADRSQQSTWYNISQISAVQFDNGEVRTPVVYEETYPTNSGKDFSFAQQFFSSISRNNSLGLNLDYDVTDNFNLELDYHDSVAKNWTDQTELGLNANIVTYEYSNWNYDLPVMGVGLALTNAPGNKGNNNGVLDGGDISSAIGTARYDTQDAGIKQLQLGGTVDLSGLAFFEESSLAFGVGKVEQTNNGINNGGFAPAPITMGNWGGVDPASFGDNWAGYYSVRDFGKGFPDFGGTTGHSEFWSAGLDGDLGSIIENVEEVYRQAQTRIRIWGDDPTTVDDPSTADVVENVEEYYWVSALHPDGDHWEYRDNNVNPDNFNGFPNGKIQPSSAVDINRTINEDIMTAFIQFHGAFEIGGMASNIVVGVRQEETDVESVSNVQVPVNQRWYSDNDIGTVLSPDFRNFAVENSYDNFLPNIDFDISPTDDIKIRASYSETMARPSFQQMRSETAIGNAYLKQASGGNPLLIPLESKNMDLSVEWYYSDDSFVSIAAFTKDVSKFIGTTVVKSDTVYGDDGIYGLRDVRIGPRFQEALEDIAVKQANGELARDGQVWNVSSELHQHDQMLLNAGLDPTQESTYIDANSTDPIQIWDLSLPSNFKDDKIEGLELSVLHWFGDSGFGVQANYTAVDSGLTISNTSTLEQFGLIGLSDTANLIGFYDKYGFQARIAYNWRDQFLTSTAQGGNNAPGYTEEYEQIDFSLSYDVNDNVTLLLEGLNVLGENSRLFGRSDRQMFNMEDLGARYQAGFRLTF